ncbi:MAG: DNA polymerase III subunit delta [Victivallales bacterium]|nr:DNA polymerase III subunit delta [Victivallales bacterium]
MSGKLYLVTGNDEYAVKTRAREVAQSWCGEVPEDNPELEIIRGDRDDMRPNDILGELYQALETPPFLCPVKKVWLKHFLYFGKVLDSGTDKKSKRSVADLLTDLIRAGLPDDVMLLLDGPDIDKRKAFFKACKEQGEIIILDKADISARDYGRYQFARITELAEKSGKRIAADAVNYLTDTIGSDTGRLHSEMEKLCCYVGDRSDIVLEDCKNICSRTPEAVSWDFANALVARNVPLALDTVDTLIDQMRSERGSGSELGILSQAVNTFQDMVKTRSAAAQLGIKGRCGRSFFYNIAATLKEKFPDNFLLRINPFRAYMLCEHAAAFSDRELVRALNALLLANRQLVSGAIPPRMALEQLVMAAARTESASR